MTPLPEIMRPYKELWGDFSDEFYSAEHEYEIKGARQLNWLGFDAYFYQVRTHPIPLDEFMKNRLNGTPRWWEGVTDYRGMLDSLGKITYEKLW